MSASRSSIAAWNSNSRDCTLLANSAPLDWFRSIASHSLRSRSSAVPTSRTTSCKAGKLACIVLVRAAPRTFSCSESDAFIVSSGTVSRIDRTNAAALAAFSALNSVSEGADIVPMESSPECRV